MDLIPKEVRLLLPRRTIIVSHWHHRRMRSSSLPVVVFRMDLFKVIVGQISRRIRLESSCHLMSSPLIWRADLRRRLSVFKPRRKSNSYRKQMKSSSALARVPSGSWILNAKLLWPQLMLHIKVQFNKWHLPMMANVLHLVLRMVSADIIFLNIWIAIITRTERERESQTSFLSIVRCQENMIKYCFTGRFAETGSIFTSTWILLLMPNRDLNTYLFL